MILRNPLRRRFTLSLVLPLATLAAACQGGPPAAVHLGPVPESSPRLQAESLGNSGLSVVLPRPGHLVVVELHPEASPRVLYASAPGDGEPLSAGAHTIAFAPGVEFDARPSRSGRAARARAAGPRGGLPSTTVARRCIVSRQGETSVDADGRRVSHEREVCSWSYGGAGTGSRPSLGRDASRHLLLFLAAPDPSGTVPSYGQLTDRIAELPTGSSPESVAEALARWIFERDRGDGWSATAYRLR